VPTKGRHSVLVFSFSQTLRSDHPARTSLSMQALRSCPTQARATCVQRRAAALPLASGSVATVARALPDVAQDASTASTAPTASRRETLALVAAAAATAALSVPLR
jgi:hypothetical protein